MLESLNSTYPIKYWRESSSEVDINTCSLKRAVCTVGVGLGSFAVTDGTSFTQPVSGFDMRCCGRV